MAKKSFIYALCCPLTKKVEYIGKSINPKERYGGHLLPSSLIKKNHKNNWVKKLIKNNQKPLLLIIGEFLTSEINKKEKFYIKKYRKLNPRLKNGTEGGDGGANYKSYSKIKCSNGQEYKSIIEASEILGISKSSISSVLRKEINKTKGLKFRYLSKPRKYNYMSLRRKKICCSNGMVFNSITEAAKHFSKIYGSEKTHTLLTNISDCCRKRQKLVRGHQFWFFGEDKPELKHKKRGKPIFCLNNNKVYESTTQASKELNLCFKQISGVLRGIQKTCHGYKFRFV